MHDDVVSLSGQRVWELVAHHQLTPSVTCYNNLLQLLSYGIDDPDRNLQLAITVIQQMNYHHNQYVSIFSYIYVRACYNIS